MNYAPTRVLGQTVALGTDPDDIDYVVQDGQPLIILGGIRLALGLSSQAALDKLATITAQAAAEQRAHTLKAVV